MVKKHKYEDECLGITSAQHLAHMVNKDKSGRGSECWFMDSSRFPPITKRYKNPLKLDHMETVLPSEYDIEQEMQKIVQLENKNSGKVYGTRLSLSVGKTVGLYLAWKEQKETIELMLKEQEIK